MNRMLDSALALVNSNRSWHSQPQSFVGPDQRAASGPQTLSNQYYKEIFDDLSVCMFFVEVTLDDRFRYLAFNPAEEKVVGLSSAE